ncbi:glutamine--fructose-6-phosphate transaminase (isomerizing) [Patescibacteria group bacterium]
MGYIGKNENAVDVVLRGLQALEYRGYDSAGLATPVFFERAVGPVNNLIQKVPKNFSSNCAIAHTRWATHGIPSIQNAHPHFDCLKRIFVVHNGIIENYKFLKEKLEKEGHRFSSDTDTEILAHLIERYFPNSSLEEAVINALGQVEGTFAIGIISKDEPGKIIAARRSSPLIIGLGEGGNFLASDVSALTEYTKKVVYLDDDEIAVLTSNSFSFLDLKKKHKQKTVDKIDWDVEKAQKGGFPHFMLKEIHEQSESIKDSLRGRLIEKEGQVKLGGLEILGNRTKDIERIVIVACGTAYYAGMIGKYMFENYAGIPTEVDLASEFRYRNPILDKNTAILAISQSGETADTLAALDLAKKKGNLTLGIVNVVGSSVARKTKAGVYNHIGPEIGVASTKAFTSQLVVLALFTLFLGRERNLSKIKGIEIIKALQQLPNQINQILKQNPPAGGKIKELAEKYKDYNNFLFLGRNFNYPIALEGALKLKEISYVHAEGYSAGEMKHGPIALIDKNFPTIAIYGASHSVTHSKMMSNVEEIKARKGPIITFSVPETIEMLSPILNVVPLQLFAYHMAVLRGLDPDKPRNLAKSVTVE